MSIIFARYKLNTFLHPNLLKITLVILNPLSAHPQNGQTNSNNSSAVPNELFERV